VATSGTSVVLNIGVVTNDIVEIVNYIASASASISGSGTSGYITKWIGTSVVNNSLLYDDGTNIGIGTITPTAKLHIVGTALVSSSLTANSFVKSGGTSAQILMADGSVITAGTNITISGGTISASGGGSITGSGTTNYHAKWTGSTALGNSLIYDNGTSIGMFNTANGLGYALEFNNNASQPRIDIVENSVYTAVVKSYNSAAWFANNSANPVIIGTNGTEKLRVTSAGLVGIGTTTPQAKLDISGDDVNRSGLVVYNANASNGDKQIQIFVGGQTAYGVTSWQNSGVIESVAGLSSNFILSNYQVGPIIFQNAGRLERMRISSNGNVGIGTISPAEKLDIYSGSGSAAFMNFIGNGNTAGVSCFVIGQNSNDGAYLWNRKASFISLGTNNTERLIIASNGNIEIPWLNAVTQIMNFDNSYRMGTLYQANARTLTFFSTANDGNPSITFNTRLGAGASATDYGTEKMRITSSGDVAIGITTTVGRFNIYTPNVQWAANIDHGNSTQFYINFRYGTTQTGSIMGNGTTTSYNVTSDYRLKEDLKPIKGLEQISKINVYDFKWKNSNNRMDGVLAHELQEILPFAVTGIKDGKENQQVDYSKIVPVLVQSIKELNAKIELLEAK
jgi:hypothetical protein